MKHASQVHLGRPEPAAQTPTTDGPDKWHLLDQLTKAAPDFDLSHRTLGVLKALLTFLPTRAIPQGHRAIVFPSNATLSRRLSGMPESTLRRHLAHLVRSGIVSRHDSPNRKRYARRIGQDVALAFGFDLSPLRIMAQDLETRAAAHETRLARLDVLRDEVLMLRGQLCVAGGDRTLLDDTARLLRRKPDTGSLKAARDALIAALDILPKPAETPTELSGPCDRNERHIQDSDKPISESRPGPVDHTADIPICQEKPIALVDVRQNCTAAASYFPQEMRDWRDVVRIGERLTPMMGIDAQVLAQARRVMGLERASIAVMCILERIELIRSPGAYLRQLCKLAETGQFSIWPMLRAVAGREIVS